MALTINELFDEQFYLETNAGVATAVEQNLLTPTEHFINFGQFEQRDPSALLNTSFYLDRYPDVAEAVVTTPLTVTEHFLNFGQFEGRLPRLLFSDIYVFGDSLSDTGNVFVVTGGVSPASPPYFEGRFSNGPVWVETLAPQLALTFDPNLNFAVGGATTGIINTSNNLLPEGTPPFLIGLQTQINEFIAETPTTDPDALYVVWAGANDYLGGENLDVQSTVDNLLGAVNKLADTGAKNFVLPNLPDLGIIPLTQTLPHEQKRGLTLLTESHNNTLATASQILEQNPNINIVNVDIGTSFDNIIANPDNFTLTNVTDNFLTSGMDDPSGFLFFDDIHPTTTVHNIIADETMKSITPIPELLSILETSL